jgi:hypothetical protein
VAKTAKKKTDDKATKKAARSATEETTPPAAAPPKGEPAGGWLQWRQTSSKEWLADDPVDKSRAGARITISTQAWKGKPDEPLYGVYRNAVDSNNTEYLGTDGSLEAAQRRAQYREKSATALEDKIEGGVHPAFLNLTARERRLAQEGADRTSAAKATGAPLSVPRAAPAAPATGPAARAAAAPPTPGQPAEPQGQAPAPQRVDVAARVGATSTAAAAKLPKVRAGKIPGTAIIRVVTKANPRRAGTGQHTRYEQILAHDGKSVAEYVGAGGHLDALTYAVEGKHVTLEGVE